MKDADILRAISEIQMIKADDFQMPGIHGGSGLEAMFTPDRVADARRFNRPPRIDPP